MFEPGQTVGVAVSGGADSVCLLHVLVELAPRWALKLKVLHLDHQLRGEESARDAEFVAELGARLELPVEIRRAEVARIRAETGGNLEETARQVRREFLLGFIARGEVDRVALGHTRSDQAETVLFRLLRGAGTAGMAGMPPVTPEGFVRPLLEVDRSDVVRFLNERGIGWREDSSNLDRSFARNRIRHELLPDLEREWNPALSVNLARMAALAQEDERYWEREISELAQANFSKFRCGILFQAGWLAGLPRAVAGRLVRHAFQVAKGDLRRVEFSHVEQVLALAESQAGHGRAQVPGLDVLRSFDWILVTPAGGDSPESWNYRIPVTAPGTFRIPGGELSLRLDLEEKGNHWPDCSYNTYWSGLDWNRLPKPLELRNWKAGDRYLAVGFAKEKSLKELFQEARVPLWERRSWPLLWAGSTIAWARRFGPAARFAAGRDTALALKVYEVQDFPEPRDPEGGSRRLIK